MKKLLAVIAVVLGLAASLPAQAPATTTIPIVSQYDYDSASFTYLVLGPSNDASLMGLGNIKNTGSTVTTVAAAAATGTITMGGIAVADEVFAVGAQTFTWKALRGGAGEVTVGASAAAAVTNIVAAITADLLTVVAVDGTGNTVNLVAVTAGVAGNALALTETATNMTVSGSGFLTGGQALTALAPFLGFTKGYELTVKPGNTNQTLVRGIFVATNSTSVVVDTAWDLSGNSTTGWPFSFRRITGGTTAGDGWFNVSGYLERAIHFGVEQLTVASGSVQVQIDCKPSYATATPNPVYPPVGGSTQCQTGAFTTAGATARCTVIIDPSFGVCRFGVKLTDDVADAVPEIVWAVFEGQK